MNAPRQKFPTLAVELWLADRLGPTSAFYPFAGATTSPQRREKFRARILELGWANRRAGYSGEQPETFGELFERIYGTPLNPTNEDDKPCEN